MPWCGRMRWGDAPQAGRDRGISLHDILAGIWARQKVLKVGGHQAQKVIESLRPSWKGAASLLSLSQQPAHSHWSPSLSWEVWCHHHLPGTGKLSFSCLKHQANTPRDGELSPAEDTGSVLFLVITRLPRPPLEVGNPTQGSRKAAGPELSPSLGAGHPCTPCQPERCHLAVDSGGYSHNRNNALQQS